MKINDNCEAILGDYSAIKDLLSRLVLNMNDGNHKEEIEAIMALCNVVDDLALREVALQIKLEFVRSKQRINTLRTLA